MSMSLDENAQVAKALVDSLSTETTTLSGVNLATLSRNDLEQLAELSQDLNLSSEMNTAEEELMETDEEIQTEAVRPELGAHEVEIETERNQSPEEIIPEIKTKTNLPPLRPLTIAPKPTRVPITLKSAGGQQLLLLQGGTAGQPLKIVSPQGQGISVTNLANLSLAKPIALRPAGKTITANNMSVLQPKQVIMKKVTSTQKLVDGKNILITEKLDTSSKQNQNLILHTPPKTITLAQAQQMGLLAGAKFAPQVGIKQSIVNKPQAKTYKIVSQGKPQTKILPAPQTVTASKGTQRIILKPTNANSSLVSPAQLIQVSSGQPVITGQLHQINIPGKGVQYIKLMTSTASLESNVTTSTATNVSVGQIKSIEAKVVSSASSVPSKLTNVVLTEAVAGSNKALKATTINPRSSTVHIPASSQLVVLPSNFMSQPLPAAKVGIPAKPKPSASEINTAIIPDVNMEANGIRPRKPCNCTKSQCLKLYCDCFANGEFCNMCNCMNCFNNLENEEHRQRAIKSCLERNPSAFRPKIGKAKDTGDMAIRKHTKGCNCKRSGCLKNYCECYEAKIACSSNCKCVSCRNVEDSIDEKDMQSIALVPIPITAPMLSKIGSSRSILEFRPKRHVNNKHAFSYITDDVIEATCQCLLAISDRGQTNNQDEEFVKFEIIEEFGKCLKEIIECSMNRSIENEVN